MSFINSLMLLFILGAIFLLRSANHQVQIFAQSPIIEPAPTLTGTLSPTPTTQLFITGQPIPAPTFPITPSGIFMQPVTPIPTLMLYLSPTPVVILPPPINDPSPTPTYTPTPTPILTYWVSFGLHGNVADQINTAEKLLNYLSDFGVEAYEIDRWQNGGWDSHLRNLPFNDFPIETGKGYEIAFRTQPNPYILPYPPPYPSPLTMNYDIFPDWNFISIPDEPFKSFTYPAKAEDLCLAINSQGGSVVEIDYHETMPGPIWTSHICGSHLNNFYVKSGYGYFLRANSRSNWTIPVPIPSDTPTPTVIPTPTDIPTATPTLTPTPTITPSPTAIPTTTLTPVPTNIPIPSPTQTPIPTAAPTIYLLLPKAEKPAKLINPNTINVDECLSLKVKNSTPKYPFVTLGDIIKCSVSSSGVNYHPLILNLLNHK